MYHMYSIWGVIDIILLFPYRFGILFKLSTSNLFLISGYFFSDNSTIIDEESIFRFKKYYVTFIIALNRMTLIEDNNCQR